VLSFDYVEILQARISTALYILSVVRFRSAVDIEYSLSIRSDVIF